MVELAGGRARARYLVFALFFVALALLLFLGAWQANRGLQKKALENTLAHRNPQYTEISRKPETWETLDQQLVTLNGQWRLDKSLLMDNRVHKSRLGYEIYTPFELKQDGAIVLVNRGWLSVEQSRRAENFIYQGLGESTVSGHLYFPEPGFTLGEATTARNSWPKVIQYFDQSQLSEALGEKISPAVLVLDREDPMSLTPIWKPYAMNAHRHFGYAVQWWGLALTLLVFGAIWRKQSFLTKYDAIN